MAVNAAASRMRAPGRRGEELYLLRHDQRSKACGEALDKILIGKHAGPVVAPVGIVVELPQMHELVDRAGIALEVANQLVVVAALLQRRETDLLIELGRFRHLADVKRVRSQFVKGHRRLLSGQRSYEPGSTECTPTSA